MTKKAKAMVVDMETAKAEFRKKYLTHRAKKGRSAIYASGKDADILKLLASFSDDESLTLGCIVGGMLEEFIKNNRDIIKALGKEHDEKWAEMMKV